MERLKVDAQYLIDSECIRKVHARYLQGVDNADVEQVRACFFDDVKATYHGRPTVTGIDNMMAGLMPFFASLKSGETRTASHFQGNLSIEIFEGRTAASEVYVIAYHVRAGEPADKVVARSLRYLDWLRPDADGEWRIYERKHTLDWFVEQPAAGSTPFDKRVRFLPGA